MEEMCSLLGTLTLGTDTGDGGLATELEGTLLAVVGALGTGGGALVTRVARDTHFCCCGGLILRKPSALHSPNSRCSPQKQRHSKRRFRRARERVFVVCRLGRTYRGRGGVPGLVGCRGRRAVVVYAVSIFAMVDRYVWDSLTLPSCGE